jgi:hypothetical protein
MVAPLHSWWESTVLLHPRFLVALTGKSLYHVGKIATRWWLLWGMCLFFLISNSRYVLPLLEPLFIIAARPSVELKNNAYSIRYGLYALWFRMWYSFLYLGCISLVLNALYALSPRCIPDVLSEAVALVFLNAQPILLTFATLFALDNVNGSVFSLHNMFGSLWCAAKMMWYNMPFVGVIFLLVAARWYTALLLIYSVFARYWLFGVDILLVAIMCNLYVKRIHDQRELYS